LSQNLFLLGNSEFEKWERVKRGVLGGRSASSFSPRAGRRAAAPWAIAALQEILRTRGKSMLEIADQLENEKKTYHKIMVLSAE